MSRGIFETAFPIKVENPDFMLHADTKFFNMGKKFVEFTRIGALNSVQSIIKYFEDYKELNINKSNKIRQEFVSVIDKYKTLQNVLNTIDEKINTVHIDTKFNVYPIMKEDTIETAETAETARGGGPIKTNEMFMCKDGVLRVLYKKGKLFLVKIKDKQTGKFGYKRVKV